MAKAFDGASLDDIFRVAGYQPPSHEPRSHPPSSRPGRSPAACDRAAHRCTSPRAEPLGAYRWHSARERRSWESIAVCPGVFLVVLADADTESAARGAGDRSEVRRDE